MLSHMAVAASAARKAEELLLLYEQIAAELAEQIDAGRLRAGQRVPSVRRASAQRGVSVATVVQAYRLLESRGLLEARPQSGYYVASPRAGAVEEPRAPRACSSAVSVSIDEAVAEVYRAAIDPRVVQLGAATIAPELRPTAALDRALRTVLRSAGARAYSYEMPPGALVLRRQLARRSIGWGCPLGPDDFLISVGASEALHLALQAVTEPFDTVVVESPGYYGVLRLLENLHLRVVEVPLGAQGMDLDALRETLSQHRVRAVLSMPNFSNPAASLMPEANKAALVKLLAERGVPLIEDDVYGDLNHEGVRPRPAKAWDRNGLVLLCGSVSKTLAPGLRVGWVSAGRFRDRVEQLKFGQSEATDTISQLVTAEFLENGGYDHHLRTLRRKLEEQVSTLRSLVAEHFPDATRVSRPEGGHVLWVELPSRTDAFELSRLARAAGVSIVPGPLFSARARFKNFIRLNAGFPVTDRVAGAVQTLARLVPRAAR
jgi:DNA-binding transcriptional MocR family regulator